MANGSAWIGRSRRARPGSAGRQPYRRGKVDIVANGHRIHRRQAGREYGTNVVAGICRRLATGLRQCARPDNPRHGCSRRRRRGQVCRPGIQHGYRGDRGPRCAFERPGAFSRVRQPRRQRRCRRAETFIDTAGKSVDGCEIRRRGNGNLVERLRRQQFHQQRRVGSRQPGHRVNRSGRDVESRNIDDVASRTGRPRAMAQPGFEWLRYKSNKCRRVCRQYRDCRRSTCRRR